VSKARSENRALERRNVKIYLLAKQIPELANLSRSNRRKVWRHYYWNVLGFWQFWVGQAALIVFAILGDITGLMLQDRLGFSDGVSLACALAGGLIGCLIDGWIFCTIVVERLRPRFRDYIATNKISN
jgi:hypothetical protein